MKIINFNTISVVIALFTIALITGFVLVGYTQSVYALSIDLIGIPGLGILKGPKGDTGPPGKGLNRDISSSQYIMYKVEDVTFNVLML